MKFNLLEPEVDQAAPVPMPITIRRGDSVVVTPDGKYVSVNGQPVDPDTGMALNAPPKVCDNDADKDFII